MKVSKLKKCISIRNLEFINILIFIFFAVFLNNSSHKYFYIFYLFTSVILILFGVMKRNIEINRKQIITAIAIVVMLAISYLFGYHEIYNVSFSFAFLGICFYVFRADFNINRKEYKYLLYFLHFLIILIFIYDLYNHFVVNKYVFGTDYKFFYILDKNYFAIILFLYFCMCYKTSFKFGYIFCLILTFLTTSRLAFLSLLLFVIVYIVCYYLKKNNRTKKLWKKCSEHATAVIALLILVSTVFVLLLSYFWANNFGGNTIKKYKTSFNDESNGIRVRANLYAVDQLTHDYKLIYTGYDRNIYRHLGIENNPNGNMYLGFRLVQPHNFVFNILLRFGIFLSITYIYIICIIIGKKLRYDNVCIILPFIFINMFMHSLLLYPYVVFFCFVISLINKHEGTKYGNIYICDNYNHLLLSIIKVTNANSSNSDLLICNNWKNDKLLNDKKVAEKIKKTGVFRNVIVYDKYYDKELKITNSKFKDIMKFLLLKKKLRENIIDFEKYDEIYMFYDVTDIGKILNIKGIKYNILEDGVDCFKNNKDLIEAKKNLRTAFKSKILKYPVSLASSKHVKSVEVNNKNGIFLKHKNIIECNKEKLFSSLSDDQKNVIKYVFLENIDFKKYNNSTLIITQPLYMDGLVSSEKQQVNIYKKIIDLYCAGDKIVIKTHPRDRVVYDEFSDDIIVINQCFPIEIFNFFNELHFKRIISVSSTSINLLKNCDEKIVLGWEWLKKETDSYEQ